MGTDREADARRGYENAMYEFLVWLWMEEDAAKTQGLLERARELEALSCGVAMRLMTPGAAGRETSARDTYGDAKQRAVRHLQRVVRTATRDAMKRDIAVGYELEWVRENMHRAFRS